MLISRFSCKPFIFDSASAINDTSILSKLLLSPWKTCPERVKAPSPWLCLPLCLALTLFLSPCIHLQMISLVCILSLAACPHIHQLSAGARRRPPRPPHLIVPTLTCENREWCPPLLCWCRATRINNSAGMDEACHGHVASRFTYPPLLEVS